MELTNIHNFIWYGDCSEGECNPYSLNSDSVIDKVYQINNGNATRVWSHDILLDQAFDTLECGYAYYITLKSNDGITPKSTIEIPGATTSYFSENNNNRDAYISDCVIPCCIKTNNGSLVNSESYNLLFNTNILPDYITGNLPEQNIDIYDNPIIAQHSKPSFYESVNENKTIVNPNWPNDPSAYWGKAYVIRDKKPENYNGTIYDWLKSKEIEYKNYPKTNYSWYNNGYHMLEPKKAYNGTIGAISIFFKGGDGYLLNVTGADGLGWFRGSGNNDLIAMSDGASGGWCVKQKYYEKGINFINTWQHLGVIWNQFLNIYEFYINGIKLPTEIYGSNTIQEKILSNRIAIGARNATQMNFKGYISDVAIYAETITEQRLLELYNNGIKSGDASDAELWYRCGNDDDEILEFGSNMENPFTSKNSGTLGSEYDLQLHGNTIREYRTNTQGPDVFHPTNSIIDSEQSSIDQQGAYCNAIEDYGYIEITFKDNEEIYLGTFNYPDEVSYINWDIDEEGYIEMCPYQATNGDKVYRTRKFDTVKNRTIRVTGKLSQFGFARNSQSNNQNPSIISYKVVNMSCLTSTAAMFVACTNLLSENLDISQLNTSNCSSFGSMFENCYSLSSLNLEHFNTSKCTSFAYMFYNCKNLTNLKITNFDTSNATSLASMFGYCTELTNLDLSNFDTSNCNNFSSMFLGCKKIENLNLSNFDTSSARYLNNMFASCDLLSAINLGNFNTDNVEGMSTMFRNSNSLKTLDLSNFNTPKNKTLHGIFQGCSSLENIILSVNFTTNEVTDFGNMFNGCSKLISINLNHFNTEKATSLGNMFNGCQSLITLNLSSFNLINAINMDYMFYGCHELTEILGINSWNTPKLTKFRQVFRDCTSLVNLDLSNLNTSQVTSMDYLFSNCRNLTQLNLNNFDTSLVTSMNRMFTNCSSLENITDIIKNFNTSECKSMTSMFSGCTSVNSLNLLNFDTSKVQYFDSMFNECINLQSLQINFDTNMGTKFASMFNNCNNLESLNTINNFSFNYGRENPWPGDSWQQYYHFANMFQNCTKLTDDVVDFTNWCVDWVHPTLFASNFAKDAGFTKRPNWGGLNLSTGNNKSYDENSPVKHIAGGTFNWCIGTQYIDPGVINSRDCDGVEHSVENGKIEICYFNKNKSVQISNPTEIAKLGLAETITLDDGSTLGPEPYEFSVVYDVQFTDTIRKKSGGRTINVVDGDALANQDQNPCPKELWNTNEINKIVHFDFSNPESYTTSANSITSLIDLTGNFSMTNGEGGGTLQTSNNTLNSKNTAHFDGSESYVSSNESQFTDTSGNHYAIGVYKITSVNDTKDSLWSFESNDNETKREYAISAGNSTTWEGEIDLDSLSTKRISNVPKIDWKTNSQIGTSNYNNNWHIYAVVFNKTTNQIYMRIDGRIASDIHPYNNKMSNTVDMRFVRNRSSKVLGCYVAEFFGVASNSDNIINDSTEIEKAEGYLAHKWGLQNVLPDGHFFKNMIPYK